MKCKRIVALLLAAALAALCLTGCAEETVAEVEKPAPFSNDGREAKLVLGELSQTGERTAVLKEIAAKYQADFPNTEIEVLSFEDAEELKEALRAGKLDLAEVTSETQPGYVKDGLLLDLFTQSVLFRWDESATLTPAAQMAASSMGQNHCYLLPCEIRQDLLYYRSDWFEAYNEGKTEAEGVYCRTWKQILTAAERLGDRGKLAFAGKERLTDYFDAMIWSSLTVGRMADQAAGYFYPSAQGKQTVFPQEKTAEGADQFLQVMEGAALPESLDGTAEEALEAFIDGRAGMLLADRSAAASLREAMPEGSFEIMGFPRGLSGTAVFSLNSFSGWGVSASAEHVETALHFLAFLSNADNNTHYAKVCGALPIHTEAETLELSLTQGDMETELDMLSFGNWYQYASEPVMYEAWEDCREQTAEKLRQFATGSLSQKDLLSWLDGCWTQVREAEGELWN